ncbi:hypothetical protein THRCLA_00711 [Thraustotheca clavata]|uniref:SAM domain-containing protein n=1 Tax=Thraustotheca clavata TaxID=74557 RepID=A0A1W0AAG7_9STRA|nr:hypothetical protein THRCLA_00711 [Thraustotheca clavata]
MLDAFLQKHDYSSIINEFGQHERTALMLASAWNAHHAVSLLLRRGANVNMKDPDGNTALHLAAENNAKKCLHLLLKANCMLDEQNIWGLTALHIAAAEGSVECTKALLISGARTDITTYENHTTALDEAMKEGQKSIVRLLREWDPSWSNRLRQSSTPTLPTWSIAQVAKFLQKLTLSQYTPAFAHADGLTLMQLTEDDLEHKYGMTRIAHRIRLLEAIAIEQLSIPSSSYIDDECKPLPPSDLDKRPKLPPIAL